VINRRAAVVVAACTTALLAACTTVVSGAGHNAGGSEPATPSQSVPTNPGSPGAPAPLVPPTGCPHVAYPAAKLSFDCITKGLTKSYQPNDRQAVWPLQEFRIIEPSTNWVLEEGAGHWGSPGNHSLAALAGLVRREMIAVSDYGANPRVHTVASRPTTVDGAHAYLLQTTFTLDPAWARAQGTKVKQEKLWILAIEVGPDDASLWYTSVPDLVKSLWAEVPATIASIKVG
jgi:hypothetical protein